jgi:RES domain-containing protein
VPLAVDAVHVSGEWIRHTPHCSELLSRSPEPTDGRWQRGEVVRGLYLADGAETAVAEWYRWLAEHGLPPTHAIPHDHHVWQLDLELADLTSARMLASLGVDLPRPGRNTWPPYQHIGETLWKDGWAGLLTRSAARPHALVACIFANEWPPAGCTPARTVEITEVPPPPTGMTT